ncbi:MAG: IS66 family transposase [Burkholderiaceae bacterium]|nr:IS66 family transposase [Burkholderiaceae bacterium]
MVSKTANPSIETPQIDLSKLGVSLSNEAMQHIVDAVTTAITPTVANTLESQIEQKVRAELEADYDARVDAAVQAAVTAAIDAAVEAAVEAAVKERIQELYEQIALARRRMFGRSSESMSGQARLFDEADALAPQTTEADDQIELPPQTEKPASQPAQTHARGKRTALPAELPRVDIVHEIPEQDRLCACGTPMIEIGEEVSEQLDIVPMQVRVLRHIRKRYACPDKVQPPVLAPKPAQVLPKTNASPRVIATLLTVKYVDGLPLARFEKVMARWGIELPRQTQARWIIGTADGLQPLFNLLQDHLLASPFIHMDETRVQVLKEPGRDPSAQSYMWVRTAGPPGRKIVLYEYDTSREARVPERLLEGYRGYLMTDGYAGYNSVSKKDGIEHLACWAHARRGFVEAKAVQAKGKAGKADEMLALIRQLYKVEADHRQSTDDERLQARQMSSVPILTEIRAWLDKNLPVVLPSHKLGQALAYMDNHWSRLVRYVERGDLPIDNNPVENSIRPFVVGRKAWLFSDTQAGAHASAIIYSLVETAKGCGLEPYSWLLHVLNHLPLAKTADAYEKLLPWNVHAQDLATALND